MRSLVVGASGQLGAALVRLLRARGEEVVGTHRSRPVDGSVPLDLRDREAVRRLLSDLRPDRVFLAQNAPGGVDACEERPAEAAAVLVDGTRHLLEGLPPRAEVVLFSSDYVFDGSAGPYDESAAPRPVSVYGKAKLLSEEAVRAREREGLVVRTTAVFDWAPGTRNLAMQVHESLRAGRPLRVPDDQWCNPTFAEHLAEASLRLSEGPWRGVFNVVGRDRMTRSQMAAGLARAMSLDPAPLRPVPTAELGQKARRPLAGGLTTEKLRRALGEAPPGFEEALERFSRKFRLSVS